MRGVPGIDRIRPLLRYAIEYNTWQPKSPLTPAGITPIHAQIKASMKPTDMRIALLIDCDKVSHNAIEGVLSELAKHGTVNVRHAHGDWKSNNLSGWIEKLHPNAVRPIQHFAYTTGKNATDSAMIIDAMDLLYSKNIDAFALRTHA